MFRSHRRPAVLAAVLALVVSVLAPGLVAGPAVSADAAHNEHGSPGRDGHGRAVFFASDGLRQDLVERYAAKGLMPTMRSFLRHGVHARGDGMLTQAPPNTGAGWYTMATGA